MIQYPSIERGFINKSEPIYAFDKLDGSNCRSEWNKKKGFWKFGTKERLIDGSDRVFGGAVGLIKAKYEKDLHDIFVKERTEKATCFFEFLGPNSFAGWHQDEEHDVTLLDISTHKKGFMLPKKFLKTVGHLDVPKLLYHGNANQLLVEQVRDGTLEGMTFEGIVCKGSYVSPGRLLMFKLKSSAWIEKVRTFCRGDEKLFSELW